ncbi:MAG: ATP-dependent RNA helicase HrpA [Actinobacteria bacterium]|uniref:ATP-dependent RNA helicase HrpA n=1 Tax=Nostocoides veronense TaxID=330836 RepID=A0ABN2LCA5_9MICO|nr:ATP-dependent RNA helicase HrpA [Actinomycetota bacterium]
MTVEGRRLDLPDLNFPANLPVVERVDEIAEAMREHQVVVIAGETGSGKTTQIPKIALQIGRGTGGRIALTQPRRIAARSVAERISHELGLELGGLIGYQVRFTDTSSPETVVKVMTDGILLNELQRDRDLRAYDTIIIDEAHERSLNIDFILGYLKRLLPRRPDLKVVITSATIDPQRFAEHFAAPGRPVPVIEVSGRTYPVEIRYRPLLDADGAAVDQLTGICEAVEELWTEATGHEDGDHDILIFLSGEREIRDAADALAGMKLPATEIVPLFSRLSAAEQHRVFARHTGRRIVLATNIAETSLTVPGIRYVVDTGTARISRYSQRLKVQRLPIEPISQASAKQRAGRCGRLADGICIRLYAEEDHDARPEFTEPEILRTSLAAVILQMTSLRLGEVARFPFIDPPDHRNIADGVRLLKELHALQDEEPRGSGRGRMSRSGERLTRIGRTLARLPVDPRMGRMLIAADELGCTREVLVIIAALSIQDPRERPTEQQAQADQAHARFKVPGSDFGSYLTLWNYLKTQQKDLSSSAFRRMCQREFLHYLRVREWQDLHQQLRSAAKSQGIDPDRATAARDAEPAWDVIHQALLTGLLSHLGLRDESTRDYLGARGARFAISPGSALFRKQPAYVMAAELVETSRLWARVNAGIDPLWAEQAGAHLVKRDYSEPRWSRKQGSVVATERVTLYGVPLVVDRSVQFGRIDPELSRDLFIRHALVEDDWESQHAFVKANRALRQRIEALEDKARRRDIVADDRQLAAFFDERIPPGIVSAQHFDRWWKGEQRHRPKLLTFTEADLTREDGSGVAGADYPGTWTVDGLDLRLSYQFDPGSPQDGVSVRIPLTVLNRVPDEGFDWLVPGMREDLVTALIRSLPKGVRTNFVPAPNHAGYVVREIRQDGGAITEEIARVLREHTRIAIAPTDWDWSKVAPHLRMTFVVIGDRGEELGTGKDLNALRDKLSGQVKRRVAKAGAAIERAGLTTFPETPVPDTYVRRIGAHDVIGYPALVDEGSSVALRVLASQPAAAAANRLGVRRLLLLATNPPWKRVLAGLSTGDKLQLQLAPHGSVPALLDDALAAAVDHLVADGPTQQIRTREQFEIALAAVRTHAASRVLSMVHIVGPLVEQAHALRGRLAAMTRPDLAATVADIGAQLDGLVGPGFVARVGAAHLPDLPRYLRAIDQRLTKAAADPARDRRLLDQLDPVEAAYADLLASLPPVERGSDPVTQINWMIEELRVGLFAQGLGTAYPVSAKRVQKAIADVRSTAGQGGINSAR